MTDQEELPGVAERFRQAMHQVGRITVENIQQIASGLFTLAVALWLVQKFVEMLTAMGTIIQGYAGEESFLLAMTFINSTLIGAFAVLTIAERIAPQAGVWVGRWAEAVVYTVLGVPEREVEPDDA